jgi:hypothetical protein
MRSRSAHRVFFGAALAVLTLAAAAPGRAQSCLTGAKSTEQATTAETEYVYDSAGHAVRGTGVLWQGLFDNAITLDGGQAGCFSGGFIDGPYENNSVYECSSEHCPGGVCPSPCYDFHTTAGIGNAVTAQTVIENVHIKDYGDGVSLESSANRAPFEVRGAWLENIHDDAVENDWGASVKVIDTLIERAWIPFASKFRSGTSIDARNEVFEVRNTLVLLHTFPNTYKMKSGHGGVFKWQHDGMGPGFIVTDSVFVAEKLAEGMTLFPLVDQLIECRNNKLLWAGTTADFEDAMDWADDSDGLDNRGRMNALAYCYTVVVKPAGQSKADFLAQHWDALVSAWKATHPAAGGTSGSNPTPTTTSTTTTTTTLRATTTTTLAGATTTSTTAPRSTTTSTTAPAATTTSTTAPAPTTTTTTLPTPNGPPQEPILLP